MGKFRKELKMIVSLLKTAGIPEPDGPSITGHRVLSWVTSWIYDGPHAVAKRELAIILGLDQDVSWASITQRARMQHARLDLRTRALERALEIPVDTNWAKAIQVVHDQHARATAPPPEDDPSQEGDFYAPSQLRAIQRALEMAGVPEPGEDGTPSRTLRWVRNAIEQTRERAVEDAPKTFVVIPKDAPEQLGLELRYAAQKRYGNGVGVTDIPPLEWEHVHGVLDLVSSWRQTPSGDDRPPPPERVKIEPKELRFGDDRWIQAATAAKRIADMAIPSAKLTAAAAGDFHTHGLEITPVGEMAVDVANALERSGIPAPDDGDLADWAGQIVDTLVGYRQQMERDLASGAQ